MRESLTVPRRRRADLVGGRPWLVGLIGGLPVLLFYWFFGQQVANVPYQDDFDGLLQQVITFSRPDLTLSEAWTAWVTQDDEHRIPLNRIAVHGQYLLTGQFSFRLHTLAGSLVLLLALGTFWVWFRQNRWPLWLFVPVPFVLFNPQYFDAIQWSIVPWQHIAVYVLALLSLWFISRDTKRAFGWAIGMAVLALLSDVSGVVLLLAGGLLLVMQQRWQRLAVWAALAGGGLCLYFYGLAIPAYRPSFVDNIRLPGTMLGIWLSMQGLWADVLPRMPFAGRLTITIGAGLLTVGIWVLAGWQSLRTYLTARHRPDGQRLFLYGGLLLFLGVFTLFAVARTADGLQAPFLTRYRFMYVTWLVLIYLLVLHWLPDSGRRQPRMAALAVGLGVVYWAMSWLQFAPSAHLFRQTQLADLYDWQYHRIIPSSPLYPMHKKAIDSWLQAAQAKGIYRFADPDVEALALAPVVGVAPVIVEADSDWITVVLSHLPKPGFSQWADVYVLVWEHDRSGQINPKPLLFPAAPTRTSLAGWPATGRFLTSPYLSQNIMKRYLHDPDPVIDIGVVQGGQVVRYQTGQNQSLSLPLPKIRY